MSDTKGTAVSYWNGIISVLVALPFVSLTGLFGKFLSHSPLLIVQGRTVFAFGALLLALLILRKKIIFQQFSGMAQDDTMWNHTGSSLDRIL
ncbi:MAG: hypothetical protein CM1200mP30_06400 [Pseudomonadota bacterium]|nr:MAG: hypothetical protein CM1200mP30_06400 [Pseudomonadota bacterium]